MIDADLLDVAASRRERKKSQTRRALRRAALLLAVERGYDGFTIHDVADAADVSTRTFFNYFPSKDAAIVGHDPGRNERLSRQLIDRPSNERPLTALRAVLLSHTEVIQHEARQVDLRPETRQRVMRVVMADRNLFAAYVADMASLEASLTDALARRLAVDPALDPYPGIVVAASVATLRSVLVHWGLKGATGDIAAKASRALDILANGLELPSEGDEMDIVSGPCAKEAPGE
jgi:AcrR family transcriptional regulator